MSFRNRAVLQVLQRYNSKPTTAGSESLLPIRSSCERLISAAPLSIYDRVSLVSARRTRQASVHSKSLEMFRRYFEETNLAPIRVRDPVQIKLMGYSQPVRGHVESIARAIDVSNAQPDNQGVATVNPIFTWVRLAQRIPVRIHLDEIPRGVQLVAGMTATVQIDQPRYRRLDRGCPRAGDQVVTLPAAHKARLKSVPGTLQFEVLLPKDDDTKSSFVRNVPGRRCIRRASERAIPRTIARRD
jgi:hypothetical protein